MSFKSTKKNAERKKFLNISIFSSNDSIIWSLCFKMSILRTSRDKWFLSFVHFNNRHRLIEMSIIFLIFWRKFARFVFWMIFCFRSLIFIYFVSLCWFFVIDQMRRNLRVSLIASSHFLLQNDLTYRLKFAQNTISFIIFHKILAFSRRTHRSRESRSILTA
jgi:hypothetical protein